MTEQGARPVVLAFDIETASAGKLYQGGHEGPFVRLLGAQDDADGAVPGIAGPERSADYVAALERADFIYGANIFKFDLPALARHCGADFDRLCRNAWDLTILARLADPPLSKHGMGKDYYSLDSMAKRFGVVGKTNDIMALGAKHGPVIEREGRKTFTVDRGVRTPGTMPKTERAALGLERIPTDDPEYHDYLRGDLEATRAVKSHVFRSVPDWSYARREMKVAWLQNRMTLNGWRVNRETLKTRVRQEDERREAARACLVDDYGLPGTKADGQPSKAPWATQKGKLALEAALREAGAEYVPRTDSGELAIGKEAMGSGYWVTKDDEGRPKRVPGMTNPEAYGDNPKVVEIVSILLEATGATAKYAEIQNNLTPEGRVHAGIGEDQGSGRWAMTKPSVTNLGKHGEKVRQRDPFVPERGHVHITCDASQVDMRAIAGLCQDAAYMELFEPGRDAHMDMAEVYFGLRTKEARNNTKGINHGLNYGQSAKAVSAGKGIAMDIVNAAVAKRAETYLRLVEWTEEVRTAGRDGRLLDNGFGRLMRCDPERAYTQAPALMGQGAARDLVCEALLRLADRHPHVTPYLRGVVHDEVVLSVPESETEYWQEALRDAFTFTWRDVPILCDVSAPGATWADCYLGE